MRYTFTTGFVVLVLIATSALTAQQPVPPQAPPLFRSSVNLVLVDVVVRDRNGAVVKGLTATDFELIEDGTRQQILTFAFEEIATNAAPVANTTTLGAAAGATVRPPPPAPAGAPARINIINPVRGAIVQFNWNSPMLLSPHNPSTLYLGGRSLFISRDRGTTWSIDSSSLPGWAPQYWQV